MTDSPRFDWRTSRCPQMIVSSYAAALFNPPLEPGELVVVDCDVSELRKFMFQWAPMPEEEDFICSVVA